ncbi:MAG: hypothetical protein RI973_1164 [Bacteroidota bacterium]|jgi:hypothetical protein
MKNALNHRKFLVRFALLVLVLSGVLYALHSFGPFMPFRKAAFVALAGFSVFSLQLYFVAARVSVSNNQHHFTQLIMVSSFAKMLLTIGLLFLSNRLLPPDYKYFYLTYISLYMVFTFFEVSMLMRIAKSIGKRG